MTGSLTDSKQHNDDATSNGHAVPNGNGHHHHNGEVGVDMAAVHINVHAAPSSSSATIAASPVSQSNEIVAHIPAPYVDQLTIHLDPNDLPSTGTPTNSTGTDGSTAATSTTTATKKDDKEVPFVLPEARRAKTVIEVPMPPMPPHVPNPEEKARIWERFIFSYIWPMVKLGGSRPLKRDDLWNVRKMDESINLCDDLTVHWKHQLTLPQYSFANAVFAFVGWRWWLLTTLSIAQRTCSIVQPLILEQILIWLGTPDDTPGYDKNEGYKWSGLMLLCSFLSTLFDAHYSWFGERQWVRIRSAVSNMVFRKSLTMSSVARKGSTTGEIVNIMSADSERVGQVAFTLINSLLVPAQLAIILWLTYETIGVATFAGLGSIFIVLPGMIYATGRTLALHGRRLKLADQRVKLTNEILQGVRVVKFYAWEESFLRRAFGIREQELAVLRSLNFTGSFVIFFFLLIPLVISISCFGTYVGLGNTLTSAKTFRALAFFNALQYPLIQLPFALTSFVQGILAAHRIQNLLTQPDIDVTLRDTAKSTDAVPLSITNGSFQWSDTPTLKNITIHAQRGKLTALVGGVGSGKSTVVSAFLGDVLCTGGQIKSCQNLGLVAQTAWIQNMSLRDNVLFGHEMKQRRYDQVIEACALLPDIATFDGGDSVEIGERGIGLSGGQKQRVALARAVYADTDVVILDDPLSAVDANVGEHLFSKCLTGPLMSSKTRFLVTNQLHFLPRVDYIYVLKDGAVTEEGTYASMMAANKHFAELMRGHTSSLAQQNAGDDNDTDSKKQQQVGDEKVQDKKEGAGAADASMDLGAVKAVRMSRGQSAAEAKQTPKAKDAKDKAAPKKFIEDEEIATGNVQSKVYIDHIKAMGGWYFIISMIIVFGLGQGAVVVSNFVLSWWSVNKYHHGDNWYIILYAIVAAFAAVFLLLRGLLFAVSNTRASRAYHTQLFESVMHAPATFFDQTPVGRLLNRFTKDITAIDATIPDLLSNLLGVMALLLGNVVAVAVVTPEFLAALAVLSVVFYLIQRAYRSSAVQLQRIESVTRSPIYQGFSEALIGMNTIRAFNSAARFRRATADALNFNTQAFVSTRLVFLWANTRVGILNALLTFFAALFITLQKKSLDIGLAGAALSFVLSIGGFLGFVIVLFTQLDSAMNSVERIRHYTFSIPQEPAWVTDKVAIPTGWPQEGHVEYQDAVMAYRPGLEPALKGVSVRVEPHEKIGIAGRTGSGKSTFMLSLFRMYELTTGRILIDNINIADIGVHQLRKRLAIIPQDPVIFSGTIRDNLDPFKEYPDEQIWGALEQCYLKEFVNSLPLKLENAVSEYGDNLSVGQRQLMCMGRALLKKPKILLMDEATSSIDSATDTLIQETVRKAFKDATVLTIAHRLNTIMDSDRIIVLEKGVLAEFDTPATLLSKEESLFAVMHRTMQQELHGHQH